MDKARDWLANLVVADPDETWADDLITVVAPPPDIVANVKAWFDASVAPIPSGIEAALVPIAQKLAKDITKDRAGILRTALLSAFIAQMKANGPPPAENWIDKIVASAATQLAAVVSDAAKEAAKQAEQEIKQLKLAAEHDSKALIARLRTDLANWAKDAEQRLRGMVTEKVNASPELVATLAAVRRFVGTVERLNKLLEAVENGQPGTVLSSAATLIQDVIGVDVRTALQGSEVQKRLQAANTLLTEYLADVRSAVATSFGATALDLEKLRKLRQEVAACAEYREGKRTSLPPATRPCSTTIITELADACDEVAIVATDLNAVRSQLEKAPKDVGKLVPVEELLKRTKALITLVGEDDSDALALRRRLKALLCDVIETTYAARCLVEQPAPAVPADVARFDRSALDRAARQARTLRVAAEAVAGTLAGLIGLLKERRNTLAPIAGIGLLGATAATVAQTAGIPPEWENTFSALSSKLARSEQNLTRAIAAGINAASTLARESSSASVAGVRRVEAAMRAARGALDALGIDVEPQAGEALASLDILEQRLQKVATIRPVTDASLKSTTFDGLLSWATGPEQANVGTTFGSLLGDNTFRSIAMAGHDAALAATAAWQALHARLQGLPVRARRAVEALVFRATADGGVLGQLKTLYGSLTSLRKALHEQLSAHAITRSLANELLVQPTTVYASSPAKADTLSLDNDLLSQEAAVLEALATAAPSVDAAEGLSDKLRNDLVMFLGSWSHRTAAPLRLLSKANDVVRNVSRGDLLSVVDLGAFRDQLEDSIAAMIPTRRRLSYKFSSQVKQKPNEKSIFQPKLESEFSLQALGIVDLLRPEKSSFEAAGALGPFSVKLVGGLIDAVELKFRGAAFEMIEGNKPRFDVAFDDFVIGRDLDFVKPLQPLFDPREGNGVFVQPMARTAGIEAGFRINLPSIGVGATSFFNISLNVSAELPFDSSEGLFKVSLGRRLAPFSMSVLPFCGSGFFSIYCGADGIRGFEASFEFGAGGSLDFGPLKAQCRIQVGVYVSDLAIGGRRITQISGTFFAGGSATLWIFNFSTALYVRLGQQDGGSMYGDAVFSFSFSLGLAKYNYAITAFHEEKPIGSESGSEETERSSAGGGTNAGVIAQANAEPTLTAPPVLIASIESDASIYREYLASTAARQAPRGRAAPTPFRPAASQNDEAAVLSAAASQADWSTYRKYFDEDLLRNMKGVLS